MCVCVGGGGGGGGGQGGHNLPLPVPRSPTSRTFLSLCLPTPALYCVSPLSCKSRCLTPYSDSNIGSALALSKIKKLCCKSNHSVLSSAIIEAAFLRHKFTPRGKIFITVSLLVEVSHDEAKMRERRETSAGFRSVV